MSLQSSANPSGFTRAAFLLFSAFLVIYGTLGILRDDIYVPGRSGPGVHFHGTAAWLEYLCFLFISAGLTSRALADDQQGALGRFGLWMIRIGFGFFIATLVVLYRSRIP